MKFLPSIFKRKQKQPASTLLALTPTERYSLTCDQIERMLDERKPIPAALYDLKAVRKQARAMWEKANRHKPNSREARKARFKLQELMQRDLVLEGQLRRQGV